MTMHLSTRRIERIPPFDEILENGILTPVFQPIVNLTDPHQGIEGFEALARLKGASPLIDTGFLFDYAQKKDRVCELDSVCLRASLRGGHELAAYCRLFVNVHPLMICSGGQRLVEELEREAEELLIPLDRIVLELTEQAAIGDLGPATATIDRLKAAGVRFAIDDVGVAYSHLSIIERIRPHYLKVSHMFGTDFEADPAKRKIVRNIMGLAAEFEADVILEGIETRETATAARDLGIRFGQGYHFARPNEASAFTGRVC